MRHRILSASSVLCCIKHLERLDEDLSIFVNTSPQALHQEEGQIDCDNVYSQEQQQQQHMCLVCLRDSEIMCLQFIS